MGSVKARTRRESGSMSTMINNRQIVSPLFYAWSREAKAKELRTYVYYIKPN